MQAQPLANPDARCFFNSLVQILRAAAIPSTWIPSNPPIPGPEDVVMCLEYLLSSLNLLEHQKHIPENVAEVIRGEKGSLTGLDRAFYGRCWDANSHLWSVVPRGIAIDYLSAPNVSVFSFPLVLVIAAESPVLASVIIQMVEYSLIGIAAHTGGHWYALVKPTTSSSWTRCDDMVVAPADVQFPLHPPAFETWTLFYHRMTSISGGVERTSAQM